ncbi:MAG: glycine oxidase ThiO [Planctomyces sp.]
MNANFDDIIVGAGVVGMTTALCLAQEGRRVAIVDRQTTGKEASWAGAGMLPPAGPLRLDMDPEARLRALSHSLWADFSLQLRELSGIDNEYRVCGCLEFPDGKLDHFAERLKQWEREGIQVNRLLPSDISQQFPGLSSPSPGSCFLPDFAQVRNPLHLKALKAACRHLNVRLIEGVQVSGISFDGDRVTGIRIQDELIFCDQLCIAAGAWSEQMLRDLTGIQIPVKPVRGQIVQVRTSHRGFECIVEIGKRYLVPRRGDLMLIGSTEEDVGFEKGNTRDGICSLLNFAESIFPGLSEAEITRTWSGLRPCPPDELPIIGPVPHFRNLMLATGHFRSGLQMSPATGFILRDLILCRDPKIDLTGLKVSRFFT